MTMESLSTRPSAWSPQINHYAEELGGAQWLRSQVVQPCEVLVSRQRLCGGKLFRLWVEDS